MDHIKGALSILVMLTTWPVYMPMLLFGATFPRTRMGTTLFKMGNGLLNGWPFDGVTGDDVRKERGIHCESDEIFWNAGGGGSGGEGVGVLPGEKGSSETE